MLTVQSDNITASSWLDRKVVNMMAAGYDGSEIGKVLRRQKDGSRKEVPCPIACVEYNKYMGGVDRGDQLRRYHQSNFKSTSILRIFCSVWQSLILIFSFASKTLAKKLVSKVFERSWLSN